MEMWIYKQISAAISQAVTGSSICLLGPSGVGKTHALRTILAARSAELEVLWIDSVNCSNTKDLRDILDKQLKTSLLQQVTAGTKKRIIVIDELETLHQLDRSLFTILSSIQKHHPNHVIVYVASSLMDKKVNATIPVANVIFFSAFTESDICIILKQRYPSRSYQDILSASEKCFGNIAQAIHMIEMDQEPAETDEHIGFDQIFTSKSRADIMKILQEDPWVNPLRYHENMPKVLPHRTRSREIYGKLLEVLCNWDTMMQHLDSDVPIDYFTSFILQHTKNEKPSTDNLCNFTKMFSNLSLQKKNEKMMYSRGDQDFPWMQAQIFCDYSKYR